jgi:hypothetical protein
MLISPCGSCVCFSWQVGPGRDNAAVVVPHAADREYTIVVARAVDLATFLLPLRIRCAPPRSQMWGRWVVGGNGEMALGIDIHALPLVCALPLCANRGRRRRGEARCWRWRRDCAWPMLARHWGSSHSPTREGGRVCNNGCVRHPVRARLTCTPPPPSPPVCTPPLGPSQGGHKGVRPSPLPVHSHTQRGVPADNEGRGRIQRECAGGEEGGACGQRICTPLAPPPVAFPTFLQGVNGEP